MMILFKAIYCFSIKEKKGDGFFNIKAKIPF